WDRDGGAERGLRHRQVDRGVDVVALSDEPFVGTDTNLDVHVAGATAERPGVTLAAQADALSVVDTCGNLDLERPLFDHAPAAATLLTRMLDELARAAARRTRA